MKKGSEQQGFTLIELLIVIAIMAILTVVAVGSFIGVQRQARVGFAADTLVATIREAQLLAKSGRTVEVDGLGNDNARKLQCFSISIASGMDGKLAFGQSNYIGLEVSEGESPAGKIDTCSVLAENQFRGKDVIDGDVIIKSIKTGQEELISQKIYFKPPFGQAYSGDVTPMMPLHSQVFTYVVGANDNSNFDTTVEYDVSTGEVKKIIPSEI